MQDIVIVNNIKKYFGDIKAVDGISFRVKKGQLFAFLGQNGAGKSTTIDMLSTLLAPDEGEIYINGNKIGEDDTKIRADIGTVFQQGMLDDRLTVRENLAVRAAFYGSEDIDLRVDFALEAAQAAEFSKRQYGKLSGGQKRRADIARALLSKPQLLFLDEPTTGLDPHTRKKVWETIGALQKDYDMTVFLTTHYMEEAADADYVTIIGKGQILAEGTPFELKEKYSTDKLKIKPKKSEEFEKFLNKEKISHTKIGGAYVIDLDSTVSAIPILKACEKNTEAFEVASGKMDDVFINITGEEINV